MPPPSTRSSSGTPLEIRSASTADTSPIGMEEPERALAWGRLSSWTSSTSVPKAPHPGHFPSQRGLVVPHSEQTNLTTGFATRPSLAPGPDVTLTHM